MNTDGSIQTFKARLVIQDFSQRLGVGMGIVPDPSGNPIRPPPVGDGDSPVNRVSGTGTGILISLKPGMGKGTGIALPCPVPVCILVNFLFNLYSIFFLLYRYMIVPISIHYEYYQMCFLLLLDTFWYGIIQNNF